MTCRVPGFDDDAALLRYFWLKCRSRDALFTGAQLRRVLTLTRDPTQMARADDLIDHDFYRLAEDDPLRGVVSGIGPLADR